MKAARKARRVQANKANYMSEEAFADLKEAMEDALAFERGDRQTKLLANSICHDIKHQPKDCSGLGARFEGTRRCRS